MASSGASDGGAEGTLEEKSRSATTFEAFAAAVQDLTSTPAVALEIRPMIVPDFLAAIGGIGALFAVIVADQVEEEMREDVARALKMVLKTAAGRMQLYQFDQLDVALCTGLRHENEFVRQVAAEQMRLLLDDDREGPEGRSFNALFTASAGILAQLERSLADDQSTVSENSATMLVAMSKSSGGALQKFFSPDSLEILKMIADADSTVHIRVLCLAARIGSLSEDAFRMYEASGMLGESMRLFGEACEDILLQMSAFEVLSEIAKSRCGLAFLSRAPLGSILRGFAPSKVDEVYLTNAALNVLDGIVEQSIAQGEYDWLEHPDLRAFLAECITCKVEDIEEIAIGAVCAIGKCLPGLRLYGAHPTDLLYNVPPFLMRKHLSTNNLYIATLNGLANLMASVFDEGADAETATAIYKGILSLPASGASDSQLPAFMNRVQKFAGNIEAGLRIAAYRFMGELARWPWGLRAVVETPVLCEHLLDRDTECDTKANGWKFTLLQRMAQNHHLATMASPTLSGQIKEYVHLGPFYQARSTQVLAV